MGRARGRVLADRDPTSEGAKTRKAAAFVAMFVALILAGCDIGAAERGVDPTSYLGATVWLLEGTVESLEVPTSRQTLLTVRVDKVVHSEDHYFWGGVQYPLPMVDPGDFLEVDIRLPFGDPLNRDQSYVFAVQAAGVPADLAAGKRSNDGALSHAVVAVFDGDGQVVQAALHPVEPIREVLALYGRGPDAIRGLIGDAHQASVTQNLQYAAHKGLATEQLSKSPPPAEILTGGPLGEWRRENGWEALNSPETSGDEP